MVDDISSRKQSHIITPKRCLRKTIAGRTRRPQIDKRAFSSDERFKHTDNRKPEQVPVDVKSKENKTKEILKFGIC